MKDKIYCHIQLIVAPSEDDGTIFQKKLRDAVDNMYLKHKCYVEIQYAPYPYKENTQLTALLLGYKYHSL